MKSTGAKGALMESTPISKMIITARYYLKYKTLTVVQAYELTNDAMDEKKDEVYNQLKDTASCCKRNKIIVVIGDLNAKVGNNTNREEVI